MTTVHVAQAPFLAKQMVSCTQGWSHDSLSGQVKFVLSFSDLHFRIGTLKSSVMGVLKYSTLAAS